ncbi:MAG: D-alanine--D-alanine ligase [Desulfobacterales bacterium]|nr:D-alanine--D-alanine ligase [Desulfobacterales bacterium]
MGKINLALLSGGASSEREVSLNSGNQVYEALDKEKYNILRYDPKTDLSRLVNDAPKIDAALIILHGPNGEDGTVQGMFDLLNIPYQGAGVLGSAIGMNKHVSKKLYEMAGVPTPPYMVVKKNEKRDIGAWVERLGLPLVVKPVEAGSSVGMTIAKSEDLLPGALDKAFEHGSKALLEAFVDGVELTCGVMGNDELEAFPLIEIVPGEGYEFFDYEAKYTAGATNEICPARIDDATAERGKALAMAAHEALECRGYSRTDMILKGEDLQVLETNTIPGMTATSLLPQAAQAAGYSFSRLLDRLIELSMEERK